jgi:hypothetical protein
LACKSLWPPSGSRNGIQKLDHWVKTRLNTLLGALSMAARAMEARNRPVDII